MQKQMDPIWPYQKTSVQTLTKEESVMFPRFLEAGSCGGLSSAGVFISLWIAGIVLVAKNLCSPVFLSVEGSKTFLSKVGSSFAGSSRGFLQFLISSCYFCSHLFCKWPP